MLVLVMIFANVRYEAILNNIASILKPGVSLYLLLQRRSTQYEMLDNRLKIHKLSLIGRTSDTRDEKQCAENRAMCLSSF